MLYSNIILDEPLQRHLWLEGGKHLATEGIMMLYAAFIPNWREKKSTDI